MIASATTLGTPASYDANMGRWSRRSRHASSTGERPGRLGLAGRRLRDRCTLRYYPDAMQTE
jgi:hypothetical protein